jgi:rod shape-determining protein MreD
MSTTTTARLLPASTLATLIAIPVLGGLMILQTSLVSRFPLLRGTTDLVMLAIIAWTLQKKVTTAWQWSLIGGILFGIASALPVAAPLISYALITWLALVFKRRVWQVPLLAMFATTFLATFISHAVTYVTLALSGVPLPLVEAFNLITLPSMLLNLLMALPIYALISDLAKWLHPEELEV